MPPPISKSRVSILMIISNCPFFLAVCKRVTNFVDGFIFFLFFLDGLALIAREDLLDDIQSSFVVSHKILRKDVTLEFKSRYKKGTYHKTNRREAA